MRKIFFIFLIHILEALPIQKATHQVELSISVDGIPKGFLQLALFHDQAQKSVDSFLKGCNCVEESYCEGLEPTFTHLLKKQHFTFTFVNNKTNTWSSEVNELHTEFGALGQERNIDSGTVNEVYKIFQRRMDFDGSRSQWLVFGAIMQEDNRRLLEYLEWTAASSDGEPSRNVTITGCKQRKT